MSDFFTAEPRSIQVIPSAPQPGGAMPAPGLGTPRVSEPRKPGDPIPAAEQRRLAIAAQRAQPCCICRGVDLLEPMQHATLQLVCKPHREERRRVQLEARAAQRKAKPEVIAPTPRRGYDPDLPNHEKPCSHCDQKRTKHGSYCVDHKRQHANARRGKAPLVSQLTSPASIVKALDLIVATRAADVLAARRAKRSTTVSPTVEDPNLNPPSTTARTCTECDQPRHGTHTRCVEHQREKWRATDARRRGSAPPVTPRVLRMTADDKRACAKPDCSEPRRADAAYCNAHKSEQQKKYRARLRAAAKPADRSPPPAPSPPEAHADVRAQPVNPLDHLRARGVVVVKRALRGLLALLGDGS